MVADPQEKFTDEKYRQLLKGFLEDIKISFDAQSDYRRELQIEVCKAQELSLGLIKGLGGNAESIMEQEKRIADSKRSHEHMNGVCNKSSASVLEALQKTFRILAIKRENRHLNDD